VKNYLLGFSTGKQLQHARFPMDILTQEQWLLNAQAQFDALKKKILADSQAGIRIDQE
jgi:hypothetical protein